MSKAKQRGVWIPDFIMEEQARGKIIATDVLLLAVIYNLAASAKGCYASNEYLANRIGVKVRYIQKMLSKLRDLGMVGITQVEGKRVLKVAWNDAEPMDDGTPCGTPTPTPCGTPQGRPVGHPRLTMCREDKDEDKGGKAKLATESPKGFGMVEESHTNETPQKYTELSSTLLKGIQHYLGATHPICRKANLKLWSKGFYLLNTQDDVKFENIQKTLEWYCQHIGEEFMPRIFSGVSFRDRYFSLENQYERKAGVSITSEAETVFATLEGLVWAKDSTDEVKVFIQKSLNSYTEWLSLQNVAITQARNGSTELSKQEVAGLVRFGEYMAGLLEPPCSYVARFAKDTHTRLSRWDKYKGNIATLAIPSFQFGSTTLDQLGLKLAKDFTGDVRRWEDLRKIMKKVQRERM